MAQAKVTPAKPEKPKAETESQPAGPVCIWKISDADNTVYLGGSVHLLREEDLPVPPGYLTAYQDSEEVVFEVDMEDLSNPAAGMMMRRIAMLPEGDELANHLSKETVAALKAYLKDAGLSMALFRNMKPGMVFLTISSIEATRSGARPELGLEMQVYMQCQRDGKKSRGLETLQYQLSRFDGMKDEDVDKLLKETLDDIDESREKVNELIQAWKKGDAGAMEKVIGEEMEDDSQVRKLLLTERNENWVPEVITALEGTKNVLFLVGTAHLIGKDSVIDLLSKKGIQARQMGVGNDPETPKKSKNRKGE